jgi:hypothetical protein
MKKLLLSVSFLLSLAAGASAQSQKSTSADEEKMYKEMGIKDLRAKEELKKKKAEAKKAAEAAKNDPKRSLSTDESAAAATREAQLKRKPKTATTN